MTRLASRFVLAAALAAAGACSTDGASTDGGGEIRLSLTGRSGTGALYRLRDAQLTIAPAGIVLSTEIDPDRETLSAVLDAGFYTIDLAPGWRLERVANGVAEPVFAVLTSEVPLPFDVVPGQATQVRLHFRADGEDVVTGPGSVDVGIDVDDQPSGADGGVPAIDAPPAIDAIDAPPAIDAAIDAPPAIDAAIDAPPAIDAAIDAPPAIDAAIDAPPAIDGGPAGVSVQYVASHIELPLNNDTTLRLDIDGDGDTENRFGTLITALAIQSSGTAALQSSLDEGVSRGDAILLTQLIAAGTGGATATVAFAAGTGASPAPCAGPDDLVCGGHLAGTGSFTGAAPRGAITGTLTGDNFVGAGGDILIELPFATSTVALPLGHARADLRATGGLVGGAMDAADVQANLVPFFAVLFDNIVGTDCTRVGPPACGCPDGSTGRTVLNLFDTDPVDCTIGVEEVRNTPFIRTLLRSDLDVSPVDGVADSLSVVVRVTAVPASFPAP
jgi:hypothetical protein